MKKIVNYLVLIAFFTLTTTCYVPEGHALTVMEEKEVGEKLLYSVQGRFDLLEDPDLIQYMTSLGDEVVNVAGIQFFDYHFFIVKDKDFNAFAAPSGLIFFYTGLIEQVDTENELVSVLAHETGHVYKRHIAESVSQGTQISVATLGLVLLSLALGGGEATEAVFAGAIAAGQTTSLHYSRIHEEQADRLAYQWMTEMGRDPQEMVTMLQIMRRIARYRSAQVPQYLLTHPNPENRIDYIQTLIDAETVRKEYPNGKDNIPFLRFKYRILNEEKESSYLRLYFANARKSATADTEKVMADYGLALLARTENNYAESLRLLDTVIAYFPDRPIFLADKGIVLFEDGQIEEAYAVLREAFDRNRNDMYSAFYLAKVELQRKRYKEATNLLKTVMYRCPEFSLVYYELGRLSAEQHRPECAAYYLGKMYLVEGKTGPAEQALRKAVETDKLDRDMQDDAEAALNVIKRLRKK